MAADGDVIVEVAKENRQSPEDGRIDTNVVVMQQVIAIAGFKSLKNAAHHTAGAASQPARSV